MTIKDLDKLLNKFELSKYLNETKNDFISLASSKDILTIPFNDKLNVYPILIIHALHVKSIYRERVFELLKNVFSSITIEQKQKIYSQNPQLIQLMDINIIEFFKKEPFTLDSFLLMVQLDWDEEVAKYLVSISKKFVPNRKLNFKLDSKQLNAWVFLAKNGKILNINTTKITFDNDISDEQFKKGLEAYWKFCIYSGLEIETIMSNLFYDLAPTIDQKKLNIVVENTLEMIYEHYDAYEPDDIRFALVDWMNSFISFYEHDAHFKLESNANSVYALTQPTFNLNYFSFLIKSINSLEFSVQEMINELNIWHILIKKNYGRTLTTFFNLFEDDLFEDEMKKVEELVFEKLFDIEDPTFEEMITLVSMNRENNNELKYLFPILNYCNVLQIVFEDDQKHKNNFKTLISLVQLMIFKKYFISYRYS